MADKDKKKSVDPVTFVRQVEAEGRKVTWTSPSETIQATIMVVIMSILVALFLFMADQIIGVLIRMLTGLGA
ncbi:preprotein translocase subunit SecE [Henriciella mobilis]|uniref:Protein translocase subunit SecE n=1 Tax=Henriciella mobilis TaxID=2305467 RepID=A0A399RDR4_9PROT|nr:preprotein translocase subunit SecE [Henriciella mobilis]RIJ16379.1 preprotein translocase subunit SecE [Henriciella mobilis]RIJ22499.1 preprotein translocase subunit SecE [Henriciella mobilis]RIJ29726.1 preprotein translocase subunit SecE [Henriciella mobilis]